MLAFNDIIRDLPYGTRGIFVSLSGYQKGAIDVAKANNITIYELRPPKSEDWDGYIKTIKLQINARFPICENVVLTIDGVWAKEQRIFDLPGGERLCFDMDNSFYDENDVPYTTIRKLVNKLMGENQDEVKHVIYKFDRNTFAYIGDKYVKVIAIEGDFGYSSSTYVNQIDAEDFTSYVLKNIISGDSKMFDKELTLKK